MLGPLSLWNPLDYLRLLYWVFFFPAAEAFTVVKELRHGPELFGIARTIVQGQNATDLPTIAAIGRALEETINLLRRHDVIAGEKEGTRIASELLHRWLSRKEED